MAKTRDDIKNGLISCYYIDSNENPVTEKKKEVHKINSLKNIVQLLELPERGNRVRILNKTGMVEVKRLADLKEENQYWVDYESGTGNIFFHPNKQAQTVEVEYDSKGYTIISADRVFTDFDEEGNLPTILGELLRQNKSILEEIFILGGGIQVFYKLQQAIADGNELNTSLNNNITEGTPLNQSLENNIAEAKTFINELDANVKKGQPLNESLKVQNPRAEQNLANLNKAITDCADDIANITKTDNGVAIVTTANWGTADSEGFYHCTVTHTANSKDLNLNIFDYTNNVQGESVMVTVTPLTDTTFKVSSIENTPIKIVFASGYYGGYTSANTQQAINSLGSEKQDKTDNLLTTNSKVIPLAINEVKSSLEESKIQINNKVEKVEGKGLSTNDYSNIDKEEVAKIKTTATKQELKVVENRIDNIITNGTPTEGNTELIDLRVTIDGTKYATAGKAVREQVKKISDVLGDYEDKLYNISNIQFEQGMIEGGTSFYDSNKAIRSLDFISVIKGDIIKFIGQNNQLIFVIYKYSSNNTGSYTNNISITVNAKGNDEYVFDESCYVKIRVMKGNGSDLLLSEYDYTNFVKLYNEKNKMIQNEVEEMKSSVDFLETVNVNDSVKNKCEEFSNLINDSKQNDTFVFFTDPHLMGATGSMNNEVFQSFIGDIKKYYYTLPFDFIACGGDWLNNGDTATQAKYKLGYLTGVMENNFENYIQIVGNHDTNYLGKEELGAQAIANIMNRNYRKSYYKFSTLNTNYFVFDTYTDYQPGMSAYKWEQLQWFGDELLRIEGNIAILMHIYYLTFGTTTNTFSDELGALCKAYNERTTRNVNGKEFNFTNCSGKVRFGMCGHSHKDFNTEWKYSGGIPMIGTTNLQDGSRTTFDMVFVDYNNNKINLIRVGTGVNRSINLIAN